MAITLSRRINQSFAIRFMAAFFTSITLFLPSCTSTPSGQPVMAHTIDDFAPCWQKLSSGVEGVEFSAGRIKHPPLEFWAVRIDLTDENIEIIVNSVDENYSAGSLPAVTVGDFALEYGCLAAMNAGPFSPVSDKIGENRILTGVFVSDGKLVSPPNPRYSALLFYEDGRAVIEQQREGVALEGLRHALGGFYAIMEDGFLTERTRPDRMRRQPRHPRSAAGLSADGFTLYLLVIDGRRFASIGATERETALLLRALGSDDGILMDGGGSSALALEIDGSMRIMNKPARGFSGRDRAVASCLGARPRRAGGGGG